MGTRQGQATTSATGLAWLLLATAYLCFQVALADQQQQPMFVYTFDLASAAARSASQTTRRLVPARCQAQISISQVDVSGIKSLNANCSSTPTEYQWHIHVEVGRQLTEHVGFVYALPQGFDRQPLRPAASLWPQLRVRGYARLLAKDPTLLVHAGQVRSSVRRGTSRASSARSRATRPPSA